MPTFYYVVSATNAVALPGSMPTANAIESTLNGVGAVQGTRSWIAPQSRITRVNIPTRLNGFLTTFARILKFQVDAPYSQQYTDGLARDVGVLINDTLQRQSSDWGPVSVTGYIGSVNGPLSWWDGTNPTASAYATRTRDNPGSALSGAAVHDENPIGPDSAIPATPTDLEALAAIGQTVGGAVGAAIRPITQVTSNATTLLLVGASIVAVGGLIWYFSPELLARRRYRSGVYRRAVR